MNVKIIYEDKAALVCYKPAGFPVQTGRVGQPDCVSELKNRAGLEGGKRGQPYLGVVHRLDQPVEGLLVFARTREAAAELGRQLQGGEMKKKYYAAVSGTPSAAAALPEQEWTRLEHYLIKDSRNSSAMAADAREPGAKRAVLRYRVLKRDEEKEVSLLEVELETGRFHQIRVQLAAEGFPLLGDRKYGTRESAAKSERLGVRNPALCAYALAFKNPVSGRSQEFTCEPLNPAFRLLE